MSDLFGGKLNTWLNNGLPIHHGGKAKGPERVALDVLGGPEGFRKRHVLLADGVKMTVRTMGEMPPRVTYTRPEMPLAVPVPEAWRLWHGLFRESALPVYDPEHEAAGNLERMNAHGSLLLRDWGESLPYPDGTVIDAYIPLSCGETYYSDFAIVPPDMPGLRPQADYSIRAGSAAMMYIEEGGEGVKTNDPFKQNPINNTVMAPLTCAWPWKEPGTGLIYWFEAVGVYDEVADGFLISIYRRRGNQRMEVARRLFSKPEFEGDSPENLGTTNWPTLRAVSVQHSPSGKIALLVVAATQTSSGNFFPGSVMRFMRSSLPMMSVYRWIVRADVLTKDSVELEIFRTLSDFVLRTEYEALNSSGYIPPLVGIGGHLHTRDSLSQQISILFGTASFSQESKRTTEQLYFHFFGSGEDILETRLTAVCRTRLEVDGSSGTFFYTWEGELDTTLQHGYSTTSAHDEQHVSGTYFPVEYGGPGFQGTRDLTPFATHDARMFTNNLILFEKYSIERHEFDEFLGEREVIAPTGERVPVHDEQSMVDGSVHAKLMPYCFQSWNPRTGELATSSTGRVQWL
jgi:hypothetical protein